MSVFGRTKSRSRDAAPLRPAPLATAPRPSVPGDDRGAPLPVPPAPNTEPPVGPVRRGDEQTLLALADGSYVLSTPDGLVAECGAGIATLLGITSEQAVGKDALALLDSGGDSASHGSLKRLLSDGGGQGSAGPAADGRHGGLELLVIPVALSYGWEFTALLTELGTREPDSWDVEDLRVQHDRAIEAIAAVREGDDTGDAPVGRLAGILIVVRPSSGPELSRDEVQARAAERFAEADAAAAAARAAATIQHEDPVDEGAAGDAPMSGLEELLDRARDLRERLEASEHMVSEATRSREEVVNQLAEVREEREVEAARRAAAEAEAERAHAEREEALRAIHSETAVQAEHAGAELEQARAMADQARAQAETARDTLEQELTAARESAATELAETRSALDSELRAAEETTASLRAELAAAGAEVDAARADAGPGSEALVAAEARAEQAEEALRAVERDAAEARAEADLARADIEMTRAELLTARDEADATRGELLAARDQIDAVRRETEAARSEAETARAEADEARAAMKVAVGDRDDALKQLVAMTAERDELQAMAEALNGQADAASRLMHALRAEFSLSAAAAPARAPAMMAEPRPEPGSGAFDAGSGGDGGNAPRADSSGEAKLLGQRRGRAESQLPPVESTAGYATGYVGLTGSFERVDEAFSKMLGYSEEELRSARWPSSIDRENLDAHREIAEDLKSGRVDTADIDTVYMHGQGLLVPVVGTIALARTDAGEPHHFVFRVPVSAAR